MKNNLIIFKENIFEKIKKWFKNLFSFKKCTNSEIINEENDIKNSNYYEEKEIQNEDNNIIINEIDLTDDYEYQIEEIDSIEFFPEPEIKFNYKDREKNVFFKLYENVKSGKVSYTDLTFDDYIKIQSFLEYEKKLQKNI